ncbi:MAG TPA: hypothetical protein VIW69_17320 [Candidatus Elarobacter sp.]
MDNSTPSSRDSVAGTQFTIDLREIELTDEEVNALNNKITQLAVETVRQQHASGAKAGRTKREPYVRITHVRSIPPY